MCRPYMYSLCKYYWVTDAFCLLTLFQFWCTLLSTLKKKAKNKKKHWQINIGRLHWRQFCCKRATLKPWLPVYQPVLKLLIFISACLKGIWVHAVVCVWACWSVCACMCQLVALSQCCHSHLFTPLKKHLHMDNSHRGIRKWFKFRDGSWDVICRHF